MSYISKCIIFLILISILSCKKQDDVSSGRSDLTGKIKTLILRDSTLNSTSEFNFIYDTINGRLEYVKWDTHEYYKIDDKVNNTVKIMYCNYLSDSCKIRYILKAYLNSLDRINKIVSIDTATEAETDLITFFTTNDKADSIIENKSSFLFSNSKILDIKVVNENVIQNIQSYHAFFGGNHKDTINYQFYSLINRNLLPEQITFPNKYIYAVQTTLLDPLYILGVAGYFYCKPNHNLLSSINNVFYYNYLLTTNSQVKTMKINGKPYYNDYTFEYY